MKSFCFALCIALVLDVNQAFGSEAGMPQLDPEFWIAQIFWLILIFSFLSMSNADLKEASALVFTLNTNPKPITRNRHVSTRFISLKYNKIYRLTY